MWIIKITGFEAYYNKADLFGPLRQAKRYSNLLNLPKTLSMGAYTAKLGTINPGAFNQPATYKSKHNGLTAAVVIKEQ